MSEAQNSLTKLKPRIQNSDENKIKSLEARFVGPSSNGNMPSEIINPLVDIGVDQIKSKLSGGNNTNNTIEGGISNKALGVASEERSWTFNNKDNNMKDNVNNILKDNNNNIIKEKDNNSNRSVGQSSRKKTPPRKAEKKSKIVGNYQIDYMTTKVQKTKEENTTNNPNNPNNTNNNKGNKNSIESIYNLNNMNMALSEEEEGYLFNEGIEFSSKNVSAQSPLFNSPNGCHLLNTSNNNINNNNNIINNGLNTNSFFKSRENKTMMNNFLSRCRERDKEKEKDKEIAIPNNSFNNINNNPNPVSTTNSLNKQSNTPFNFSLNNLSNLQTPDSNYRILKKIQEENDKLSKENFDYKKSVTEKEKEADKLKSLIQDHEDTIKSISIYNKQIEHQIQTSKLSMIKYLREMEELKRNNKKKWLSEQEYRLGKAVLQRVGQTTIDIWEEGEEVVKLTNRIKEIDREKLELEAQKSNLSSYIKKRTNTAEATLNNTSNDLSQDELSNLKELIAFKLANLQKEEMKIRETLEKMQIEKTLMTIERKRLKEEECSRFGNPSSKEKYPVLANRYLILSLLGKGGYSEVYRAYDMDNSMEVACKIHQLNPQWSDTIKENYIRHTIRENQIHKEINHSKIVKHYDTIEIDNNSFCTVLELCSGPDLHTYLKMYKTLSEKEARAIVSQILSGLEYMNKLQRKIIHYDLKPQNIIFHNMEVKISDFGLAKVMENNVDRMELTSQGVGTYWYLPPECFDTSRNIGISSKVDIWSLGVILFELLYGSRPFGQNCTQDKILKDGIILNAKQVSFPIKPLISKQCREFIEKCLARNQESRMNVFEALEHEFIKPNFGNKKNNK